MLPLPSDHHKKLPGFLVEIGLGLLHHSDRAQPTPRSYSPLPCQLRDGPTRDL